MSLRYLPGVLLGPGTRRCKTPVLDLAFAEEANMSPNNCNLNTRSAGGGMDRFLLKAVRRGNIAWGGSHGGVVCLRPRKVGL